MGASLSCFGSGGYRDADEPAYEQLRRTSRTKVRPSDEDGLWYIGERDVDRKASEFIARFHARSGRARTCETSDDGLSLSLA